MFRSALVALAAGFALSSAVLAQDDSKLKVKEGDKFPDIAVSVVQAEKALPGKKDVKEIKISDLKGKTVVVFFYPKAMTSGCTVESCGFRDELKNFPANTVIVGASADSTELNQKFIDKEKLPYALLCDTEMALIKQLGIKSAKGNVPQRLTFVIDGEGTIKKIYPQVSVKDHPKQVLEYVKTIVK